MNICETCEHYLSMTGHCNHPQGPVYAYEGPWCYHYKPNATMIQRENQDLKAKNEALDKRATELVKSVEEKEAKISELMQQLADKNVIIKDLNAHNDELIKDFGEAAKEVEEKSTLIIKLGNEDREKEAKIASLTQELADSRNHYWSKDSYTKGLEDQLDSKSYVVSKQELQIEDLKKKLDSLLDHNKALRFVLRSLYPETFKTWYLGRPMTSEEKEYCDTDIKATKGLSYKCCPEIKKLIDDSKERLEHDEWACRSMETFNLDVSSLYPKKFDFNPNADCPAYAARMKAKYDCLRKVGFTEDQTMSLLPLWIDE